MVRSRNKSIVMFSISIILTVLLAGSPGISYSLGSAKNLDTSNNYATFTIPETGSARHTSSNHERNIDIDICIRCTQPGPPGPPGPTILQDLVHVVWDDNTPGNSDVLYRKSSEAFAQSTLNLSDNLEHSSSPVTAVSGTDVHMVWRDSISGGFEILYRKSTDGGATFSSSINLSNNNGDSQRPAIAVSRNNIYVIWSDDATGNREIFYRKSTDGGATFGNIVNLSNSPGSSNSPSIAVSGDDVHVIWTERAPGAADIRYMKSSDAGTTFGPVQKLNDNFQDSGTPDIAIAANNVYIVWQEDFPGADEIYYRRSADGGTTFDNIMNLSNNPNGSESPVISASGNSVYIVWRDFIPGNNVPGNREIVIKISMDGGASFGPIRNVSNTPGGSENPAISVLGSNLYVVWMDSTAMPDEFNTVHDDILYRASTDNGISFGSTINLSTNAGDSFTPDIATAKAEEADA